MKKINLETILRGPKELIARLEEENAAAVGRYLAKAVIFGAGLYGWSMGIRHSFTQAAASSIKVPALFLLTLAVCLPSLHFVGQLFGLRVRFSRSLLVLLGGMAASSTLLAGFAPLALFFLLSGSTYSFLLLFHVAVFAFAGYAGIHQVREGFHLLRSQYADEKPDPRIGYVLSLWMLLYMFVGAQMAYTMAPFIGRKSTFTLFRYPDGSFVGEVLRALRDLLA